MSQGPIQDLFDLFTYCRNCGIRLPSHGVVCPRCRTPKLLGRFRQRMKILLGLGTLVAGVGAGFYDVYHHRADPGEGTSIPSAEVRRAEGVPTPTGPGQTVAPLRLYTVAGLKNTETLNVRNGPGASYDVIDKLVGGRSDIQTVGAPVINGSTEWVHIRYKDQSGWVSVQYLRTGGGN